MRYLYFKAKNFLLWENWDTKGWIGWWWFPVYLLNWLQVCSITIFTIRMMKIQRKKMDYYYNFVLKWDINAGGGLGWDAIWKQ